MCTSVLFVVCLCALYTQCVYVCVCVCVYLHPHVGQDDAAGHPALGGRAAKPLEVLVHTVLPERRLDRSRSPPGDKLAPVLPLQHLHLSGGTITHRQPIRERKTESLLVLENDATENRLCSLSCSRTRMHFISFVCYVVMVCYVMLCYVMYLVVS